VVVFILSLGGLALLIVALTNASMWVQRWQIERKKEGESQTSQPKDHPDRSLVWWTGVMGGFATVVLAIVACFQLVQMNTQSQVMGRQLNAMEADQRPWISVSGKPRVTGSLKMVSDNWVSVDLNVSIKNTGRSPARRVNVALELIGSMQHMDRITEQKRYCLEMKKHTAPKMGGYSRSLPCFPVINTVFR
jgi:hypothetical protein